MGHVNPEQLLEGIREAVQEIASTMLYLEIMPDADEKFHFADPIDFVATIPLGEGLSGGLCLAAPEEAALHLAATLLMETRQVMDDEMKDGFGELANMIAGGVQLRMEPHVGPVSIAPPHISYGTDVDPPYGADHICTSQYFSVEGHYFVVEVYHLPGG